MVSNPGAEEIQVQVGADTSEFTGSMDSALDTLTDFNKKTAAVAAGGIAALAGALAGKSVSAAADFESAMADVEKVTDEATAEELTGSIQDLSEEVPLATGELASLAAQAGRFGVEGSENIEEFTRVAGEMGAATTLSADEAGRSLAKVAEATGEPLENVQQLGDSINELSNNFATNSQEIVDSAQRAGFALQDMGLESDQILGLSAAMNEVAPTSRRAATMLQQVTEAIKNPDNAEQFANVLGVSVEEFNRMREENPQETILALSEAMAENEEAADSLSQNLSNAQARAFDRLTGRSEELASAMETSNKAMEEGGSLSREVGIETDTLQGQFELLKSELNNVAIGIGQALLPGVKALVGGIREAIDVGNEFSDQVAGPLNEGIETLSDLIEPPAETLADELSPAFEDSGDAADEFVTPAENAADIVGDELEPVVADAARTFEVWQPHLRRAANVLRRMFVPTLKTVEPLVRSLADLIGTLLVVNFRILSDAIEVVLALLRGDFAGAIEETRDLISTAFGGMSEIILDAQDAVGAAIDSLVSVLLQPVRAVNATIDEWNVGQKLKSALVSAPGVIANAVSDLASAIIDPLPTQQDFVDLGGDLVDGLVTGLSNIGSAAKTEIKDAADAIGSGVTSTVKSAWNTLIPDTLNLPGLTLPEVTIGEGTPFERTLGGDRIWEGISLDLPQLATGGFIPQDMPAMLHSGERVLPDSQVSDRGEASFDPDSVADGFDNSETANEIRQTLESIDQAVRDDGTVRISERDLVRGLQRLFDRQNTTV